MYTKRGRGDSDLSCVFVFRAMKLFSSDSSSASKEDASQLIPSEILSAVRVMGEPVVHEGATGKELSTEKKVTQSRSTSPFLSGSDEPNDASFSGATDVAPISRTPIVSPPIMSEPQPLFDTPDTQKNGEKSSLWVWIMGGVAVLTLAGGLYWYFVMRESEPQVTAPTTPPQVIIETTPVVQVEELPYSIENPNYLTFDTETVTVTGFQELLRQASARMLEANMGQPVEFYLTDKNNNPIAFSRFAYLMNIGVKPEFLAQFDEKFSLFLYNDAGQARIGLMLSPLPAVITALFETQKEGSIPAAFGSLLYEGVTVPKDVSFRSGTYQEQVVRYVNIDTSKNISFDHAVTKTKWFIGTSKDTLRAMLDTVSEK